MITINHSGDGTTVDGTTRDDALVLKRHGFRRSRNLGGWFLPRTWRETTRRRAADQLFADLGPDLAEIVYGDAARSTTAEERADQLISRAAELADRHTGRAERLDTEAHALFSASEDKVAGIPFGQPILVGHYSQRRHEKALSDSWRLFLKSADTHKAAVDADARAKASARRAESYDDPPVVGRRIKARKAELGRWTRSLATAKQDGRWFESAIARVAELEADIARDERVLEESGVLRFNRSTVKPGDRVKIRGDWAPVVKSNPTTVVVKWPRVGFTLDYIWAEVQDHRAAVPTECPHCGSDDVCDQHTGGGEPVAPGVVWCGSCGQRIR